MIAIIECCYYALTAKKMEMYNNYGNEKDIIDRELVHLDELTHGEH